VFFGLLLGAPLCVAALIAPRVARAADEPAHCTVRIVHALDQVEPPGSKPEPDANHDGAPDPKIDPKIDRLRPYLLQRPFTAWREFVLLDKRDIELKMKQPQAFPLPNGKTATVTFVDHLPDQAGHHHRVRVQLQIGDGKRRDLNTVFIVDEGSFVLQAGQPFKQGMLVLATSCEQTH
jgi:hypothetical protein